MVSVENKNQCYFHSMLSQKSHHELRDISDVTKAQFTLGFYFHQAGEGWELPLLWWPPSPLDLNILLIQRTTAVADFLIMVGVVVKIAPGGGDILITQ